MVTKKEAKKDPEEKKKPKVGPKPLSKIEKAKKMVEALIKAIEGDYEQKTALRLAKDLLRYL